MNLSSKNSNATNKTYIKRIPARRIKKSQADYLNGFIDPEQALIRDVNKL